MLIGEYNHTLDAKGRVNFPVRFREEMGDRFIVTRGLDTCLAAYSMEEWARIEQRFRELPLKARMIQRAYFSGAAEVEVDGTGRILLPQNLRTYAGLKKEVTVLGLSTYAEIWDTEVWMQAREAVTPEMMVETLGELGF